MLPPTSLIIDCDTGRDDALAIWLALRWSYALKGLVASYGNTMRDNVSENCLRVLAYVEREDIEVMVGANAPAHAHKGVEAVITPRQKASGNGMCNLELPKAARAVPAPLDAAGLAARIKALAAVHGKLDYVITGPATNFAAIANELGADLKNHIARVTMMGGKLPPLWDAMPTADFNIICDPHAVETVLTCGVEARLVTMNTTWHIALPLADVEALEPHTPMAEFSKALMIAHCKHFAAEPVFRFHDPSVITTLADDNGFVSTALRVVTDESADDFGRLLPDAAGHAVKVYQATDARRAHMLGMMLEGLGFKAQAKAA